MKNIADMNEQEKLEFIKYLTESEERYFSDYSQEIAILIDDPVNTIRIKAIDLLWDEPGSGNMNRLLEFANNDPAPEVRQRAIVGLGRYIYEGMEFSYNDSQKDSDESVYGFEDEIYEEIITKEEYLQVRNFLLNLYNDENRSTDEQRFAMEALSFAAEEDIQAIIRKAYNSPHKNLKISSIFAMGRNGLLCWKNILLTELNNQDENLQRVAIKALGEIGLQEAGPQLLQLTYSTNPETAKAAIWALAQTGWQEAYERLDELCQISNKKIQKLANAALEEWLSSSSGNEDDDRY